MLLQPKNVEINGVEFIIHKFPAFQGTGIFFEYARVLSQGSVFDRKEREAILLEIVSFAKLDNLQLIDKASIDIGVKDYKTLVALEEAILRYNDFFLETSNTQKSQEVADKAAE